MVFKVLGLHGSQQNAEVLRTRLGRIVPKVKAHVSFVFLDAPHVLPLKAGDEVSYRTWYLRGSSEGIEQSSLDESLLLLMECWREKGPFDGIFGFSQGGAIASLLATRPDLFPGLKFVILAGSPDIEELIIPEVAPFLMPPPLSTSLSGPLSGSLPPSSSTSLSPLMSSIPMESRRIHTIKSLHFGGKSDYIVLSRQSLSLAAKYDHAEYIEHEQGHCIPTKPHSIAIIVQFLESVEGADITIPTGEKNIPTTPRNVPQKSGPKNVSVMAGNVPRADAVAKNVLRSVERSGGKQVGGKEDEIQMMTDRDDKNQLKSTGSKMNNTDTGKDTNVRSNGNRDKGDNNRNKDSDRNVYNSSNNTKNEIKNNTTCKNDGGSNNAAVTAVAPRMLQTTQIAAVPSRNGDKAGGVKVIHSNGEKVVGGNKVEERIVGTKTLPQEKGIEERVVAERIVGERVAPIEKVIGPPGPCTSEGNAAEQRDEVEALTSIFSSDEIVIRRPAPCDPSKPSACISAILSVHTTQAPQEWQGELQLVLDFPPGYPGDPGSDPGIEVDLGRLSLMAFPTSYRRSLLETVRETTKQNSGTCSAFACIQAANDWLDSEGWKNIPDTKNQSKNIPNDQINSGINSGIGSSSLDVKVEVVVKTLIQEINASGWVPRNAWDKKEEKMSEEMVLRIKEKEGEVEEKREWEYVKIATEEACRRAAGAMKRRNKDLGGIYEDDGDDISYNDNNDNSNSDINSNIINSINNNNNICNHKDSTNSNNTNNTNGTNNNNNTNKSKNDRNDKNDTPDSDDDNLLEAAFHSKLEPSASARGVWGYTVGLVGKPSAGKSTFFNAATCAALRGGDGRKMADVAPHPFTTIEPNIGPGWFSGPRDNPDGLRSSSYGRDSTYGRLLPVLIKDVAGLVPGAYKGRGKGNRFLADLCDADVLVHVVDATGRSDRDGNALGRGEIGSTPSEDAQWIREELHRWIYGNVRAKWPSVCRRGIDSEERVANLFTGYKGTRSSVELAALRARLDMDLAPSWTTLDLHRLVAHYLSVRFPICLALNKIDAFPTSDNKTDIPHNKTGKKVENTSPIERNNGESSGGMEEARIPLHGNDSKLASSNDNNNKSNDNINNDNNNNKDTKDNNKKTSINTDNDGGRSVVAVCRHQAISRGELAVPVSAFAENWHILKQAHAQSLNQTLNQPVSIQSLQSLQIGSVDTKSEIKSHINSDNTHNDNKKIPHNEGENGKKSKKIDEKVGKEEREGKEGKKEGKASEEKEGEETGRKRVFPLPGSRVWVENEAVLERVMRTWKTTGVLEAVSAAVSIKLPVYCYPVGDLETEAPMGWVHGMQVDVPRLRDCILLHPGSTVGDVYDALKKGAVPHITVHGDFVRAEGKSLELQGNGEKKGFKKRQLGRDVVIDATCCVVRIQTNRKTIWQDSSVTAVEAAAAAAGVLR